MSYRDAAASTMTTDAGTADEPAQSMQAALLNMLTPLLIAGGLTDPVAARRTLAAAVGAYAAHGAAEWLAASQILGYALSGLDSLRVSAGITAPDMVIALRDNAARMAASAARAERSLAARQRAIPPPLGVPEPAADAEAGEQAILAALATTTAQIQAAQAAAALAAGAPAAASAANRATTTLGPVAAPAAEATPPAAPARKPEPPRPVGAGPVHGRPASPPAALEALAAYFAQPPLDLDTDRLDKLTWAGAMTEVAQECAAALPRLPPARRRLERIRISALSTVARNLTLAATQPPPGAPPPGKT